MYEVIGAIRSRTRRVLWMLEEIGADYTRNAAAPHSDEARAINPTGKIPALIVDGTVLTDSTAIVQFLADRHGQFTFETGTIERAQQDGFTQLVLDEFDSVLWMAGRHTNYLPEDERIPEVRATCAKELARNMASLAPHLEEQEFLMGDVMTVPDLILAHCLDWAKSAGFEITEPVLRDYAKRLRSRDAYRRTLAMKD